MTEATERQSFLPNERVKRKSKITRTKSISIIDQLAASALTSTVEDTKAKLEEIKDESVDIKNKDITNLTKDPLKRKLFEFFYKCKHNQACADCKCPLTLPENVNKSNSSMLSASSNIVYCSFSSGHNTRRKRTTKNTKVCYNYTSVIKDTTKTNPKIITNENSNYTPSDDIDYDSSDEDENYFKKISPTQKSENRKSIIPWSVVVPKKQRQTVIIQNTPSKISSGGKENTDKSVITGITKNTEASLTSDAKIPQNLRLIKFKEAHSVFAVSLLFKPWI